MGANEIFRDNERMVWQRTADTWVLKTGQARPSVAYFWEKILELAVIKVDPRPIYRGKAWMGQVTAMAELILEELGVPCEIRCGQRYVAGVRVWQSFNGSWEQDD